MATRKTKTKKVEEESPVQEAIQTVPAAEAQTGAVISEMTESNHCCKEVEMVEEEVKETIPEEPMASTAAEAEEMADEVIYTEEECEKKGSMFESCQTRAEQAAQATAKVIYKTFYGMAFGVVYSSLFVGEMFRADNPVFNGMRDGASAAKVAVHSRRDNKARCTLSEEEEMTVPTMA